MKTKTRRVLFWAAVATGAVLPWLTILFSALASGVPPDAAFRSVTDALPLFPLSVILLAAWWALPFVVFAFLCDRLATGEWEPLRRNPLLILLGIPVAVSQMGATESFFAGLYLLLFLAYATIAVPSWGLRSPVARILLGLFGFLGMLGSTLLSYAFIVSMGSGGLRQHVAPPLGILYFMTMALFVGYLFAKPIDLLVTRGEPIPDRAGRPKPGAWLIGGNALACGAGFIGVMLAYSKLVGSVVTRHEIGQVLAEQSAILALAAITVGLIPGLVIYLLAFGLLRKGRYPRETATLAVLLAILPGFLAGIGPGLIGEPGLVKILDSVYLRTYFFYGGGSIDKIAVSPDGSRIAAEADGRLVIWDVASGDPVVDARSEPGQTRALGAALAWSPDAGRVSVSAPDGRIAVLDGRTGLRLHSLELPKPPRPERWQPIPLSPAVAGAAFSRDGARLIAAADEGAIHVYELAGGKPHPAWPCPVPARKLTAIAMSPDGRRLAVAGVSASDSNLGGGFIAVLDVTSGEKLLAIDDFEQVAGQLAFSPDGSRLLFTGFDNPPQLIDAFTGRRLGELRHRCPPAREPYGTSVFHAAFLGSRGVAVACGGGARVCDTPDGDCRVLFELRLSTVGGVAAHPNGRHVAFLENGRSITLWDAQTAEPWLSYRLP